MLLLMKQRLSDGEGTARSSSLQPLWKAIIKDMASFFELQQTDIKKHKKQKLKNTKTKKKKKKKRQNNSYNSNVLAKSY